MVLTCCLVIYVIVMPVLFRGGDVHWPLAVGAGVADVAAIGALITLWASRGANAAALRALTDRGVQADVHAMAFREREQQLMREAADLSAQCVSLRTQCSELRAQCSELRAKRSELQAECGELRDRLARDAQDLQQAVEHAVTARLPAAMAGDPVPAALTDRVPADLAKYLDEAVAAAGKTADRHESMRAAVVALGRRVQTSAHRLQEEATLMADRHPGNADVLEVAMRVDHAAAQQARHAQSMAVLCGEWPGQQWPEPLPLVDVVRAAAGRIIAYQRVEVAGDQEIAAAAPVVEPLIHLVAELLANATQSSPPTTQVPVTVRAVQRGAVIEIHDCGVGMDEHQLAQAREVAAGERVVGLDELGEFPQTGLPVVGQYVRRHGFRADLSESVYGGVRAVVGVPADSVETVEPADMPPVRVMADSSPAAAGPDTAMAVTAQPGLLPRRHSPRHETALRTAPVTDAVAPVPSGPEQTVTPEEAGAWMGAFLGQPEPADATESGGSSSAAEENRPAEEGLGH
jgi:signal transduction histidine kinase